MTRLGIAIVTLVAAASAHAETVYRPGHLNWNNTYVPPHYETVPDTRYVAPRNQPLDKLATPANPTKPPVSVYTPAPQYDPYYNALDAATRPLNRPVPLATGQR